MKIHAYALSALLLAGGQARAQQKEGEIVVDAAEAVVTVVEVDQEARTVVVRGPGGKEVEFAVPPEAQNLDQVHPGSKFRVQYVESVAVSLTKGGAASGSVGRTVKMAPKGDTPGGVIVQTAQVSGVVESIDQASRLVSVRGPQGRVLVFTADDSVEGLDQIEQGDVISVEYTQAIAMRMIKEK
jgi:hypothetical protein